MIQRDQWLIILIRFEKKNWTRSCLFFFRSSKENFPPTRLFTGYKHKYVKNEINTREYVAL